MIAVASILEADLRIILERALFNKTVVCFGEDGLGQHGRSDVPKTFRIRDLDIYVIIDEEDPSDIQAGADLFLDGYNSNDCGYAITDKNFEISLSSLLRDEFIDPSSVTWGPIDAQGMTFVNLVLDVKKLLG